MCSLLVSRFCLGKTAVTIDNRVLTFYAGNTYVVEESPRSKTQN